MIINEKILKRLVSTLSVDGANLIVPLITLPILTQTLGLSLYGEYLLFLMMGTFLVTIIDFGIGYIGVRKIVDCKSPELKAKIFSQFQGVRWIIFIAVSILIFTLSQFVNYQLSVLLVCYLLGTLLFSEWYFFAFHKIKQFALLQLSLKISQLIFIIFFIDQDSFNLLIEMTAITQLLIGVVACALHKGYHPPTMRLSVTVVRAKQALPSFLTVLMPNSFNSLPYLYIGHFSTTGEFAYYAIAHRLTSIIINIQSTVTKTIFPLLSKSNHHELRALFSLNIMIAIPSILVCLLLGNEFIKLLTGDENNNPVYLSLLVISSLFVGVTNTLMSGYYFLHGRSSQYGKIVSVISLTSFIYTVPLIYFLDVVGCCLSLVIARLLMMSFSYLPTLKKREACES